MAFTCKTCGSKLRIRTSSEITKNTRQVYYECIAVGCGEEYSGLHTLGDVVRPSLLNMEKITLDSFMCAIPKDKRAAVLKILNN